MYEQVFNFRSRPFTTTPFVKHYFAGSTIEQSLGQARLCIDRASGPVVLVGDIGTGKSLFLAMLEEQYKTQFQVINLGCSRLENRKDLLQSVLFSLERPVIGRTETELRFDLMALAKPSQSNPNGMLLLVDDADALAAELIDELSLITNYVVDGVPRVRLVLAGRQGIEDLLSQPKFASFEQRIATRCYLTPLTQTETFAYVNQHIERAGVSPETIFDHASLAKIHELTQGVPRLINQVADFALIIAGTRGERPISAMVIEEAWSDVQSIPGLSPRTTTAPPTNPESEKSDWTVIEFGQLSDDAEGQVYEFGAEPEPINEIQVPDSPALQLPSADPSEFVASTVDATSEAPAPNNPEAEPAEVGPAIESPSSSIDPDLGIDLAALQQLQAKAGSQESSPQAQAPAVEASLSEPTPAESTEQTSEPNELGRSSISAVPDEAALQRQKEEMAAQFAAVFGTEVTAASEEATSETETVAPSNLHSASVDESAATMKTESFTATTPPPTVTTARNANT